MTLRSKLFLLFGGLLAILLGAQWWMLSSFAKDLDIEVEALAISVGESIVEVLQKTHREPEGVATRAIQIHVTHNADEDPEEGNSLARSSDACSKTLQIHHKAGLGRSDGKSRVFRFIRQAGGSEASEEELFDMAEKELSSLGNHSLASLEALRKLGPSANFLVLASDEGVEQIPIPMTNLEERVRRFKNRMLAGTGALLMVGLIVAGLFAHGMTRPLRQLASATRRLGEGDLGARVEASATGEVEETIQAFNQMSSRLRQLEEDTRLLRAGQHLSELGEVSRGLAHSLRNPLNALGLSLDRLGDDDLEAPDRRRLAVTARQQIRRVDGSLRSFLALASSGSVPEEEVDVAALIQDVALEALQASKTGLAADDEASSVILETEIDQDLPRLRAVQPELRAVLQALVVNAVEASPKGGRIRLQASSGDRGGLRFVIEDEGPGLPGPVRERLFSPHVTTKEQGSGMGLFLAQRIAINRYGGKLRLEDISSSGKAPTGTRVILEIGPRITREGANE